MSRDTLRELVEQVAQLQREARSRAMRVPLARGGGGGGGGGSSSTLVLVVDDLSGYDRVDGESKPGAVRCLTKSRNAAGDGWVAGAPVINAEPVNGVRVVLADEGCGCGGAGTTRSGLVISPTLMEDNRITSSDQTAVRVTGSGVDTSSTVEVEITDGSNTASETAIAPAADGSFSSGDLDVSSHNRGLLLVRAREIEEGGAALPWRTQAITYAKGDALADLERFTGQPVAPKMQPGSDTGSSNTDNRTSKTQPVFDVETTDTPDTVGPGVALLFGANTVRPHTLTDFDSALKIGVAPDSPQAEQWHLVQCVLVVEDGGDTYYGPCSPALPVLISASEAGDEVVATAQVNGALAATTDPIPIDNVTVTENTTGDPDPSPLPTTVAQPSPAIALDDNTEITLVYDPVSGAWSLRPVDRWGREGIVTAVGGVNVLHVTGKCPVRLTHAEVLALGESI